MTRVPAHVEHGDAVSFLSSFADGAAAHVVTDPPYSAHTHKNMRGNRGEAGIVTRDPGYSPMTEELRDAVCREACRVATGWLVFFSDWESVHLWKEAIDRHGGSYRRVIPWVRWSSPQFNKQAPPTGSEAIVIAKPIARGRKWLNGSRTHYDTKCLRSNSKLDHPKRQAEKPEALMREILSDIAVPGDLVLDPFAGAGTTLVACQTLGLPSAGCELDAEWVEIANQRLAGRAVALWGPGQVTQG